MESPHTLVQLPREPREPAGAPARRRITPGEHAADAPELVLGRYRTLERLGSGGFGVVWRAHDELLHREVALKRVWLGPEGDGERASREALAAARLAHPAIVALHEACAQDGAFYLISELVDGDTLAQLIVEGALEDEEILEIGAALASALLHAHARGVIHRDIKPQNVLVPRPPGDRQHAPHALGVAAKLTDFGGASLVGEDALTRTGDVLGTLAYMSPEQSEGREVGVQSDLYSLALVIYEALCDVNPVRGATPAATARRIGQRLPSLQRARRDLPRELTAALDRALAPAPAERGSLEELRAALEHALERGLRSRRTLLAPPRPRQEHAAAPLAPHRPRHEHAAGSFPGAAVAPGGDGQRYPGEPSSSRSPHRLAPTRAVWLACGLALIVWQALAGRPGVALLALAALLPLLVLSGPHGAARGGAAWLVCLLAPALGYVGLAGAFPAIAGQASRWRERAALAALGFWWLTLAAPLLDTRLWLGEPDASPTRAAWEGSVGLTATHVIGPLLTTGVLLGAVLWASAAAVLPWIVRGRSAVRDLIAVGVWAALLAAASPVIDAGLSAHGAAPDPRGLVLGAVVGALFAVAARALRGPISGRPSERVRGAGA